MDSSYEDRNKTSYNPVGTNMAGSSTENSGIFSFDDKKIRHAFIRKVYLLLFLQLLVTSGIICIFVFVDSVKDYVKHNSGIYWASYAVFLVTYIALVCVTSLRRKVPWNFVALVILTLSLAYMTATISAFYDTKIVLIAIGITAVVTLSVTVFTFQTKFDITSCYGFIYLMVIVLLCFGITCIFTRNEIVHTVYAALGAMVFTLILAFDTKSVIGGGKYEMTPEEYIFAAVQLYVDVAMIFLLILGISGSGGD